MGRYIRKNLSLLVLLLLALQLNAQGDNLYGLWAQKAGAIGDKGRIYVHRMIKDSQSNVYICGTYAGYTGFSENTCTLESAVGYPYVNPEYLEVEDLNGNKRDATNLQLDAFIAKYDNQGKFVWSLKMGTEVLDMIPNIVLSDNEQSLVFLIKYGNASYAKTLSVSNSEIEYGNGTKETLTYNEPRATYQNFHLGKVSTTDGSKIFGKYLGYGANATDTNVPNTNDRLLWLNNFIVTPTNDIIVFGLKGTPSARKYIAKYDNNGNYVSSKHPTESNITPHVEIFQKNNSVTPIYSLLRHLPGIGADYCKYVVKIDPVTMEYDTISKVSAYARSEPDFDTYYGTAGINLSAIDVDNANKNLFLVGDYSKTFTYISGGEQINCAGDLDAMVVCLDPTTTTGVPKWIVKLSSVGAERIHDCQFDPKGNNNQGSLKIVGTISSTPVDFNPLGAPMLHKSLGTSSAYYAEYDLSGKCLKVEVFGKINEQAAQAVDLGNNKITIFGNFSASPFDLDPSGRLRPLRTSQKSNFLASYSIDPNSTAKTLDNASYSAATNIVPTYDLAIHSVLPCIQLGVLNNAITPESKDIYSPSGYTKGTINPNYDGLVSFKTDKTGKTEVEVKFINDRTSKAYLAGWIDFNNNGKFEPDEVSDIIQVPENISTAQVAKLTWLNKFPKNELRGMDAFMRIRLTSEVLDGTWFGGEAMDGEVEDYQVKFPPLASVGKESRATNITYVSTDTARVGDTITYKIKVESDIFPLTLFDSIPDFVDYVPNSATLNGVYSNKEVRWNVTSANTFEFKVVPTSIPNYTEFPDDKNLYNIAILTSATDTITSADNCEIDSIYIKKRELKTELNDDYETVLTEVETLIDITANDVIVCADDISITLVAKHGTASLRMADTMLIYKSDLGFIGRDSVEYTVACTATSESYKAKVYIKVIETPSNMDSAWCVGIPPGGTLEIENLEFYNTNSPDSLYQYFSPLSGDVDGDGNTEIIALFTGQRHNIKANYYAKDIAIIDGKTGMLKDKIETPYIPSGVSPALYKANGDNYIVISTSGARSIWTNDVLQNSSVSRRLVAYKYNKTDLKWEEAWMSAEEYFVGPPNLNWNGVILAEQSINPMVADLNGDGIPEIIMRDKVFNALTGTLLCSVNDLNLRLQGIAISIGDVLDRGDQQIVIGGKIFTVDIVNTDAFNPGGIKLAKTIPSSPFLMDKHTVLADFNNDGHLDVLMVGPKAFNVESGTVIYAIWDVFNNKYLGGGPAETPFVSLSGGWKVTSSLPLVGDVNNDGVPEFVFMTYNKLYCFRYDKDTDKIEKYWEKNVNDQSGATGITLFDFDQDGSTELVYRDEQNLYILDGSVEGVCTEKTKFTGIYSGTGFEYPIIADVNDDGFAEIVTLGSHVSTGYHAGKLYVLGAKDGNNWAPARKVWNQYAYNAVNVNDDLTIPRYPTSPADRFAGVDETLGTDDDVRPYNGFLQQQTTLNKNGLKLWLLPNAKIGVNNPTIGLLPDSDSLEVSVTISNKGSSALASPLYITVYKDVVIATNPVKHTYEYKKAISPNDSVRIIFHIPNYTTWIGATDVNTKLILKINDKGDAEDEQPVCENGETEFGINTKDMIKANVDNKTAVSEVPSKLDVLTNDNLLTCTPSTMDSAKVIVQPKNGTAQFNADGTITYTSKSNFVGIDSLDYFIQCGTTTSRARVYITVINLPKIILLDSCSFQPYLSIDRQYIGATYKWEYSEDDTTFDVITGVNGEICNVTKEGYYKTTITFNGSIFICKTRKLILDNKSKIGTKMWYKTHLE